MNNSYWAIRLLVLSIFRAFFSFQVVGAEKRIEEGGAIIASNHVSFLDPPLLGAAYSEWMVFMARRTLFKGLHGRLFRHINAFPIDQQQADLKSMKAILRMLKGGERVVIFPEGSRSFDGTLQKAMAGIGMLVAKSGVPVQPVRILGAHEALPRNGKLRLAPIRIIIGDPITFKPEELAVKSREGYQAIADRLMKEIAALAPDVP